MSRAGRPAPQRRRKRRRLPVRTIFLLALLAIATIVTIVSCTGSPSGKKNTVRGTPTAGPASGARGGAGRGNPRTAVAGTPGAGFALASPAPLATCAPADLLRLVDKNTALPPD